jgi:hypothetical protein
MNVTKPVVKVRVAFTLEMTPEQFEQLYQTAKAFGHGHGNASKRLAVQRYLGEQGANAFWYPKDDDD